MSPWNLRKKKCISYYEPEEPPFDEYVYCEKCADFVYEYCSIHGPSLVVPDDKVPADTGYPWYVPRAALTIPIIFLHVAPSAIPGAGLGVFSSMTLPCNVRFGPYRGIQDKVASSSYCWQIYDKNNRASHVIDAEDPNKSNWMRYVNCARHCSEQNLVAFQYQGQLYYRTIKIVPRYTELLIFYGSEFANYLNIDVKLYNTPGGLYKLKYVEIELKKAIENFENGENALKNLFRDDLYNDSESNEQIKINLDFSLKLGDENNNPKNNFENKKQASEILNLEDKQRLSQEQLSSSINVANSNRNKNVICEICNKCITVKNIKAHMTTHTGEKPFSCNLCSYRCSDKGYLTRHMKTHSDEKPYLCDVCNRKFKQKRILLTHMLTHTGEKPFSCNLCRYRCSDKRYLTRHMKTHSDEKPYLCDVCNRKFKQKRFLLTHMLTHTGEKPVSCNLCSYRCSDKGYLTRHMKTHSDEKPYLCDVCNRKFKQKRVLLTHMLTHTGENPFSCNLCSYRCSNKGYLTRHMKTHSDEKPYLCDVCNRKFKKKRSLQKHMDTHTCQKTFICDLCSYSCSEKNRIRNHIRTHSEEMPYLCQICNYRFKTKKSLVQHVWTHATKKP